MTDPSGAIDLSDRSPPEDDPLSSAYRHSTVRKGIGLARSYGHWIRFAATHSWCHRLAGVVLVSCRESRLYGWFTSAPATERLVLDVRGIRSGDSLVRMVVNACRTVSGWVASGRIAGRAGRVDGPGGPGLTVAVGIVLLAAVTSNLVLLAVTGGVSELDLALRVSLGVVALFLLLTRPSRTWVRHSLVGRLLRDDSNRP